MRRRWTLITLTVALPGLILLWAASAALTGDPPVAEVPASAGVLEADTLAEASRASELAYSESRASFSIVFKDDVIPYSVFGIYVMPGEEVELEAVFTEGLASAELTAEAGAIEPLEAERWQWTAPEAPGVYEVVVRDVRAGEAITLNAFVLTPFDHSEESIGGYRIGDYQDEPLRGNPVYNEPPGFIKLTPENRDVLISPHFTLAQFQCKQGEGYPKYLLVRERLLLKLETILEEVRQEGIDAQTLYVMSAYRTPFYNASIGNRTRYSRHLYGGAADIFVDTDGDDHMDDLDGDGRVTEADARYLAGLVEDLTDETWYQPFVGGLGIYAPAPHRGPFIHVDVRGHRARW